MRGGKIEISEKNKQTGFTLVELSVALIVIGIAVLGIMKWQEAVESSNVISAAARLEAIGQAHDAFVDQHGGTPGDFSNAVNALPDCAGACINGNGNGDDDLELRVGASPNEETIGYLGQLWAAGLIDNMNGTLPRTGPSFGTSNPRSPAGGGLTVGDT